MENLLLGQFYPGCHLAPFCRMAFSNPLCWLASRIHLFFSSRIFSCQFSSLDGQKFGVSGHSPEWPNKGVAEAPRPVRRVPTSGGLRGSRCSVCCSLGFLPLSFLFSFLCLKYAAEKWYSLTKARPYLVFISPIFFKLGKPQCAEQLDLITQYSKEIGGCACRRKLARAAQGVSRGWFIHHRQEHLKTQMLNLSFPLASCIGKRKAQ